MKIFNKKHPHFGEEVELQEDSWETDALEIFARRIPSLKNSVLVKNKYGVVFAVDKDDLTLKAVK